MSKDILEIAGELAKEYWRLTGETPNTILLSKQDYELLKNELYPSSVRENSFPKELTKLVIAPHISLDVVPCAVNHLHLVKLPLVFKRMEE